MELETLKDNTNELNENQINNLFNSIIQGKDVTEIVHTSRGDFKIKFPRMKDIEAIGRLTAYRLNGIPAKCFDENTYLLMNQIASLDILVVSGPSWYELAKKENSNFSWQDIPSQLFIQEVYAKAYEFRNNVQKQIESNSESRDIQVATGEFSGDAVKPGLFEGVSG